MLFLRGQTKTGVGLVVLYGAAALSRQTLEPRLVGKQVGLNPVLTLLALYTGYRLLGVGGMIVFRSPRCSSSRSGTIPACSRRAEARRACARVREAV